VKYAISILGVAFVLTTGAWAQNPVAPNEVRLCEHENYQGKCVSYFLKPHMRHRLVRHLPTDIDNRVSSMGFGDEIWVFVFPQSGFVGDGMRIIGGQQLIPEWNDEISSLVITRPHFYRPEADPWAISAVEGVLLLSCNWGDTPCDSAYFPLPEIQSDLETRIPTLGKHIDNRALNIWTCGFLTVELYTKPHFKGKSVILEVAPYSGHNQTLASHGIAHDVSSMVVRSRSGQIQVGQSPPVQPPERGGEAAGEPHRAPPAPEPRPDLGDFQVQGQKLETQPPQLTFEHGMDRPGADYRNFDLPEPRPELCRDACAADQACKAYTYVKPGIQGAKARCWLKSTAGPPRPDGCCVSGVKP
jgi:hypothetical protein